MSDHWGEIRIEAWRDTPCTIGRAAREDDVREGRAVFYVDGPSEISALPLPCCALLKEESGSLLPVIVIQAEGRDDGGTVVGYRPLSGGNGICMLNELELLDEPNDLFL